MHALVFVDGLDQRAARGVDAAHLRMQEGCVGEAADTTAMNRKCIPSFAAFQALSLPPPPSPRVFEVAA